MSLLLLPAAAAGAAAVYLAASWLFHPVVVAAKDGKKHFPSEDRFRSHSNS